MQRRILHAVAAALLGAAIAVMQGALTPAPVIAHGGGLDSRGCHNDRQRGEYHCHRGPLAGQVFGSASEAIDALAKLQGTAAPATPSAKPAPAAPPATRSGAASIFAPAVAPTTPASVCGLDRRSFEQLVGLRMQNYESTGDSWSARAARWRTEIAANVAAGKPTAALDAAFGRFNRYCSEGDNFMAGIVVGEWSGWD